MEKKTKAPARPKATATPTTRRAAKSPIAAKPAAKTVAKTAAKPRTRTAKAAPAKETAARSASTPRHDQIAQVAYSLFEQSGCRHGQEVEHWLEAESRLSRGMKL